MARAPFEFSVIPGDTVREIIQADLPGIVDLVAGAYRAHARNQTVNPPSQFLRFPDRPNARIISLPAHLGGDESVSGVKWIASYPDNIKLGIPRASAVLLLNDATTGYPFACLESSIISAARTAASAVLGAYWLNGRSRYAERVGFIGAGVIARYIVDFFVGTGWRTKEVMVFDLVHDYARKFAGHIASARWPTPRLASSASEVLGLCDLVVFATTAATPHVKKPELLQHKPRVLHISLRDLAPELILAADNIVDDVDHCLTASTSAHLAEQMSGNRSFIKGTIADVIDERVTLDPGSPVIFSPFGMGILDLAVGKYVHEKATAMGRGHRIPEFFFERSRW